FGESPDAGVARAAGAAAGESALGVTSLRGAAVWCHAWQRILRFRICQWLIRARRREREVGEPVGNRRCGAEGGAAPANAEEHPRAASHGAWKRATRLADMLRRDMSLIRLTQGAGRNKSRLGSDATLRFRRQQQL